LPLAVWAIGMAVDGEMRRRNGDVGRHRLLQGDNRRTRKKVESVRTTLEALGIDGRRVRMFNLSPAMAPEFARIAGEMTETVKPLGPLTAKMQSTGV
jgi:coenzyme F420-reducing hydrogenase delta subunit